MVALNGKSLFPVTPVDCTIIFVIDCYRLVMFIKSFCVTRQKSANESVTERVCDRDNMTDIYLDE